MGILIRRPNPSLSSGETQSYRERLSDGDDGTFRNRSGSSPYIWGFDAFDEATDIPGGTTVVALRTAQRIRQTGSYDGWPESFLRRNGTRVSGSRLFDPSISSSSFYTQRGPALYTGETRPWTEAEVNEFTTDTVRFMHNGDSWYSIADAWMEVIYSEPLSAPTDHYPADSATIDTSTVAFTAELPAPQPEQYVRAVFQVATDSGFTTGVRTFYGAYHGNSAAGARAQYIAVKGTASDTDLPPGTWYLRARAQDYIGGETAWSATTSFSIVHAALPVPSLVSPVPGSTSPTPYGIRSAAIAATPSDGRAVGAHWQFSQDPGFGSGIVEWTNSTEGLLSAPGEIVYDAQPDPARSPGAAGAGVAPGDPSQYLVQGTWHGRARTIDKWGQHSAFSAGESFSVDHKPRAQSVKPTSHQVIDQSITPASWQFSDPWSGDAQTAFRVRAYDEGDALVYDSAKTSSSALQHVLAIDPAYLYDTLRMVVNLYDADDATPTNVASHYFVLSQAPDVTMSFPAAEEEIGTGQPTFAWDPGISRPGTTQKSYHLTVLSTDNNAVVLDTGVVQGNATTHTPGSVILRNNKQYRLELRIVDTDNLSTLLERNFSTSYQAPAEPELTVDTSTHDEGGYVRLDWSATPPDDFFVTWVVYRKPEGSSAWTRVAEIPDASASTFDDWLVPAGSGYQWSVTQVAERSGLRIESGTNDAAPSHHVTGYFYHLIMPSSSDYHLNMALSVTGDSFSVERETSEYNIHNRGRKVNYGTYLGMSGTLSVRVRPRATLTAREQRARILAITDAFSFVLLKDPFGQVTTVALGDISVTRIAGTGQDELVDMEIPYKEVSP